MLSSKFLCLYKEWEEMLLLLAKMPQLLYHRAVFDFQEFIKLKVKLLLQGLVRKSKGFKCETHNLVGVRKDCRLAEFRRYWSFS
jgi:hypothetical protein